MFRIFSAVEIQTIAQWINSLSRPSGGPPWECYRSETAELTSGSCREVVGNALSTYQKRDSDSKYAQASVRDLYYYLVNIDRHPDIRPFCQDYVLRLLERVPCTGGSAELIESYDRIALMEWFYARHRDQVAAYGPLQGAPNQSREELIDQYRQACPMFLIDGAWLQKWSSPHLAQSVIGSMLFQIYSDEIGNGTTKFNHTNIFRSLMGELGLNLPEFDTWEFAHLQSFEETSFALPAFLLCLSQCSQCYLPETLGLNLAIELFGVDNELRRGSDLLRYYGYSSLFLDVHNTIDNLDTGHSRLALTAILEYMRAIASLEDHPLLQQHWLRIRRGHQTLRSFPASERD
jgi:hypothetical protein